ncbi:polysaccharide chain length determinant protein, PEP-CTERM locus subfamily [Sphingomonas sp. NFR04]|uniref:XrtA system polysaccharide chain length determinant n=1 Tax=Sphingomonas sp. NFR04 TaxID=1566283 RepID=UPI0008EAA394|nr:XrtA system polysaccharide chain length determinant [Sphingomonas sp. NFR04]SFJ59075.1 polysaccharide chain length determinant protein, PEP-CTERM locus subfamily [Sphingomonas sp. NFR04]
MGSLFDEVRSAIHAVWMRRTLALAIAWAVCVVGWIAVSRIPDSYESKARVLVELRQVLPNDGGVAAAGQQQDIDRIRQTLTSSVNLEKVVRGTDLAKTITKPADLVARIAGLQKAIKLTAQQDNLFEIAVTGADPAICRQVVEKLIALFRDNKLADSRDESSQSLAFLDQQLAERQQALQVAEAKRAEFQTRFLGSLPGTGSLDDRIGAAQQQLQQIESDLAAAQSSLSAVNAQMAGTPASVAGQGGGPVGTGPARARLADLQAQLSDARARGFTEAHPDVVALKRQIAGAQAAAAREPSGGGGGGSFANPLYLSLRAMQADKAAQVAALSQRRAQIQGDLAALSAKLTQAPQAASEQGQIDRDYQVLKDQYAKLLADREQLRISSQAQSQTDAVKFSVIDPPTQPRAPSSPNRPMLLTAVLVAGLGAGVAAAFLLSKLRTTFDTAIRLERASGMPVIGSIGEVVTPRQRARRRKQLQHFLGGAAGLGVAYAAILLVGMLHHGAGV